MLAGGLETLADTHGLLLFHWHTSKLVLLRHLCKTHHY
jgi:hypothetical protein